MKINCKKCNSEVIQVFFTEEQKLDLYILMQNDLKIFAKKKLVDEFNLNKDEANIIIQHLNKQNGKCSECACDSLEGEYTECSNCGAFNYNLIEPMFNLNFCTYLEWSLDFQQVQVENEKYNVKNFWCDGVLHLPKDTKSLLYENIKKDPQIITKAWIGYDGNEIYEMKIKFGKKSLENYKNNKSLTDCIPNNNEIPNWITINPDEKKIEVQLK